MTKITTKQEFLQEVKAIAKGRDGRWPNIHGIAQEIIQAVWTDDVEYGAVEDGITAIEGYLGKDLDQTTAYELTCACRALIEQNA